MNTIPPITITVAEARLLADLLDTHADTWKEEPEIDVDTALAIGRNYERAAELRQLASDARVAFRAAYAMPEQ